MIIAKLFYKLGMIFSIIVLFYSAYSDKTLIERIFYASQANFTFIICALGLIDLKLKNKPKEAVE